VLKAACYVNLGIKFPETYKILEEVLKAKSNHPFALYCKGLALFSERKFDKCIPLLEKLLLIKPNIPWTRAEIMLKTAKEELANVEDAKLSQIIKRENPDENEANDDVKLVKEEEMSDESDNEDDEDHNDESVDENVKVSKDLINKKRKRFGCELCDKYFGKKFNLDRHNKSIHNRKTPYIPPMQRSYARKSAPAEINEKILKIKEEIKDEEKMPVEIVDIKADADEEKQSPTKSNKKKKKKLTKASTFVIKLGAKNSSSSNKKIKRSESMPSLTNNKNLARCRICKKLYRKGSLARHEIIHTGQKPHQCDRCDMAFYQKSDLQRHVVSFVINLLIIFVDLNNLIQFQTIHSDVFDYECELCDKKFRIKKNLQVHNKRHHSN
jgi:hypothetical protein